MEQLRFYKTTLGFKVLESNSNSFSFQAGATVLEFVQNDSFKPYHFAFNIPSYQEHEALEWLKQRVSILKDGGSEIADFSGWDAKAMYFYDADKNIVEFISRRRISEQRELPFSSNSVLSLSELGLVTDDIPSVYEQLEPLGLPIFDGNMHRFCAIGDDEGLFITVNPNEKKWFPTDEEIHYTEFEVSVNTDNRERSLAYSNNQIDLK